MSVMWYVDASTMLYVDAKGSASRVGVGGTLSNGVRLPSEPARLRVMEMKLSSRRRFGVFGGGEGGVESAGRSTESIDQRDSATCSLLGRTDGPASGDDTEGASEASDGRCDE